MYSDFTTHNPWNWNSTCCPGPPGRLSAISVFLSKSVFYGVFVWARRALNSQRRRFPARAVVCVEPHRCGRALAGGRQVGRCTSDDFVSYPNCSFLGRKGAFGPQHVNARTDIVFSFDAHDAPCLDVYTNQVLPLPGGGHYLMFPSFFEHFPEFLPGGKRNDGLWSE